MYTIAKIMVAAKKLPVAVFPKPNPVTYIGEGKVLLMPELLDTYGIRRVLVVTDQSLLSLGLLTPMLDRIKASGIEAFIYDEVQPDPTYDTVNNGLAICRKNQCDGIVAFGGGSVLDSAKVISLAFANQCRPEALKGMLKAKKMRIPLFAVPTTAGTGSETTIAAVISNPATHTKTVVVDGKGVPDAAILDPALTAGLPPHITAATAMDALTHALEAYISGYATTRTKRLSEVAIRLIYKNIRRVFENPGDLKAREDMLVASFYAGMAFTATYVGYVHAFAHNYGGKFGIPHGLANAVVLPHVMQFSLPACQQEFAHLAAILKLDGRNEEELAQAFVDSIWKLNEDLKIPKRLDKFPKSAVEEICTAAFKEAHGTYPVPRYMTRKEAVEILNQISV